MQNVNAIIEGSPVANLTFIETRTESREEFLFDGLIFMQQIRNSPRLSKTGI
jgi:hypothetical protein